MEKQRQANEKRQRRQQEDRSRKQFEAPDASLIVIPPEDPTLALSPPSSPLYLEFEERLGEPSRSAKRRKVCGPVFQVDTMRFIAFIRSLYATAQIQKMHWKGFRSYPHHPRH